MFTSIKHWLDEVHDHARIFENHESEVLHVALASLLYRVIVADGQETHHEKTAFSKILKHEFDLSDDRIAALHERVKHIDCPLQHDIDTLAEFLKDNPGARLSFMSMLTQLVSVDGVKEREMELFYKVQHALFPDTKQAEL